MMPAMPDSASPPTVQVSKLALALTLALLWGCAMAVIGTVHAIVPSYGAEFFAFMASIYPGISGSGTPADIAVGVLYGLLDGFFAGYVIAWLYNLIVRRLAGAGA